MMAITNILMASDFSTHANYALQRAIALAKAHDAPLHFVHVISNTWMANFPQFPVNDLQQQSFRLKQESEAKLLRLLNDYSHNASSHVSVLSGRVSNEIIQYADENNCCLIVAGAHGDYYINDHVLGTTSAELVRQSDIPVLLVKKDPTFKYKRILIATDFSKVSQATVEYVARCFPDATFQLLHIVDIYYRQFLNIDYNEPHLKNTTHAITDGIMEKFDTFLHQCDVDASLFKKKIIGGYFADTIVMQAEKWKADLLCFGTQGHSMLHYFLMGSVAKRILQLSTSDMLVVPPEKK